MGQSGSLSELSDRPHPRPGLRPRPGQGARPGTQGGRLPRQWSVGEIIHRPSCARSRQGHELSCRPPRPRPRFQPGRRRRSPHAPNPGIESTPNTRPAATICLILSADINSSFLAGNTNRSQYAIGSCGEKQEVGSEPKADPDHRIEGRAIVVGADADHSSLVNGDLNPGAFLRVETGSSYPASG